MIENVLAALIEEVKRLNDNLEQHNDILVSHYASIGELELEVEEIDFDDCGLDS